MVERLSHWKTLSTFILILTLLTPTHTIEVSEYPTLAFWDYTTLLQNKRLIQETGAGLKSYRGLLNALRKSCDEIVGRGSTMVYSVTVKNVTAVSGDKHDYLSLARYYWPNPDVSGGVPYVRKDGEPNPEVDGITDQALWKRTVKSVQSLSLGYFFLNEQRWAAEAARIIRQWFLDSDTAMNPHLKPCISDKGYYGEFGRPQGIIDFREVYVVFDALQLIEPAGTFSESDRAGLQRWFTTYLDWLWTGQLGSLAREMMNNHGTWYRVQVAAISIFVNRTDIGTWVSRNLTWHIDEAIDMARGGVMRYEIDRVNSFGYSAFDLRALLVASRLASTYSVNLLRYQGPTRQSIPSALDFLIPHFLKNGTTWPYSRRGFDNRVLLPVLKMAMAFRLDYVVGKGGDIWRR
ncbi:alginate lyase-domain-containing protein [Chytridium lagenaria]|nr:alginate lyase-domain-containing protein [Chytridium lagenaria]